MKRLTTICIAGLLVAMMASSAHAALSTGTPSPSLSPVFGTLIDFDDQATGTVVGASDYVSLGVAAITETTGGTLSRYASSQSLPNYIGTGAAYEIGGAAMGWDGTIQIDLVLAASMIGIGVADSAGGPETLSVYDSGGTLLESYTVPTGSNVYAVITRPTYDISRITLSGDFFAADDLQFNAVPVPGAVLLGMLGLSVAGIKLRKNA